MHSRPSRPDLPLRMLQFRDVPAPDTERLAHDLFFNFNIHDPIRLTAHGDWGPTTQGAGNRSSARGEDHHAISTHQRASRFELPRIWNRIRFKHCADSFTHGRTRTLY